MTMKTRNLHRYAMFAATFLSAPFFFKELSILGAYMAEIGLGDVPTLASSRQAVEGRLDGSIFFIHVGKAGGATMFRALNGCEEYNCLIKNLQLKRDAIRCRMDNRNQTDDEDCYRRKPNETMLEALTWARMHNTKIISWEKFGDVEKEWLLDNTKIFLFSVRDPINRLISAYNYHNDKKKRRGKFYKECFPSGVENIVETLRQNGGDEKMKECRAFGMDVLMRGTSPNKDSLAHLRWGYRKYYRQSIDIRPNHTVAVIRTENLWEDMTHMDKLVGGDGNFVQAGSHISHGSELKKAKDAYLSNLSPINRKFLCCVLYDDMDAYQTLIMKAANLDNAQKRETLLAMMSHCDITASVTGMDVLSNPFSWLSFYNNTCKSVLEDNQD